jgi:hypothetical protein
MPRIRIVPDQLRFLGTQLRQAATDLRAVEARVTGALNRLDLEVRAQANIEAQAGRARERALALAGEAETLARYLTTKADEFDEADAWGANALQEVAAAWSAFQATLKNVVPLGEAAEPVELTPVQGMDPVPVPTEAAPVAEVDDGTGGKAATIERAGPV